MVQYVLYLKQTGLSIGVIKKQLAGISFFFRIFETKDVTKAKQMLKGIVRCNKSTDSRNPITLVLLKKLIAELPAVCFSAYETILFSHICFFAAFRASEIVSQSKTGGLEFGAVALMGGKVRILIKKLKTDQEGKGKIVWLGSFHEADLCPVRTFSEFLTKE
ncbi:hypothetical protein XELAEV_18006022mg [Xenopus laevis]|uniref:Uncharacterized protein n=1 Tax=Xenopus laevis TaxID=8355 RepID=A0A974DZF0_XENLA|nr:hypothetical protein XELAEV_18006022mg [Xenopus laevis]